MTIPDATAQSMVTARPTVRRTLAWRQAVVSAAIAETATARTLVFDLEGWHGHVAGQHVDVRLTADDGYQATRSYSLSSGPDEAPQITVEPVTDGEVSPYLVDVLEPGDEIELRGPIGGYFIWEPDNGRPLLIGGGSGIAPLRAIWRANPGPTTVLYSARSTERVIFASELATPSLDARVHLTRVAHRAHRSGRIMAEDLRAALEADPPAVTFVCGPTAFVETIARHIVDLGVDARTVRTERFG